MKGWRSVESNVGCFNRADTMACFSTDGSFPVVSEVLQVIRKCRLKFTSVSNFNLLLTL